MKSEDIAGSFPGLFQPTPWEQLPDLGLYMDQVILYIDQRCRAFSIGQKNFMTPAMINNYVKAGLIKRPNGKKYDRSQLAQLMMLCTLKQAASLDEMKQLISPTETQTVQQIYAGFCETQDRVIQDLATRPPAATAMEYAIEAAAFRQLCSASLAAAKKAEEIPFPEKQASEVHSAAKKSRHKKAAVERTAARQATEEQAGISSDLEAKE